MCTSDQCLGDKADVSNRSSEETKIYEIFCPLERRRALVRNACHSNQDVVSKNNDTLKVIYNNDIQLLFCRVNKAGCISAQKHFASLSTSKVLLGYKFKNGRRKANVKIYGEPSNYSYGQFVMLKEASLDYLLGQYGLYRKVMIVRHPLQRLVSAYYQVKDMSSFRVKSFHQFVTEAVLPGVVNPHFLEYHRICQPCVLDFDYVLKVENLAVENREFNKYVGIDPDAIMPHIHPSHMSIFKHSDDNYKYDSVLRNFEQEYPELFDAVLDKYRLDMEMYGYTWTDHKSGCLYPSVGCC